MLVCRFDAFEVGVILLSELPQPYEKRHDEIGWHWHLPHGTEGISTQGLKG